MLPTDILKELERILHEADQVKPARDLLEQKGYGDAGSGLISMIEKVPNFDASDIRSHVILIDDMGLSVRSYNCLKNAGLRTLGDLLHLSPRQVLKLHNCGKKSLVEIELILKGYGVSLKRQ